MSIISLNETHLCKETGLFPSMLGLGSEYSIFRYDRNTIGGGVALILKTSLKPVAVAVPPSIEVVAVKVSLPIPVVIVAVYRPPTQSMSYFSKKIIRDIDSSQKCTGMSCWGLKQRHIVVQKQDML